MKFHYNIANAPTLSQAQAHSFLLCNGLGGYCSMTSALSAPRADQGILVAAVKAPNQRITLVHRLRETLTLSDQTACLSTQEFADKTAPEEGFRYAQGFSFGYTPHWEYRVESVSVLRRISMAHGRNTTAVLYEIQNTGNASCTLHVAPICKFAPKETTLDTPPVFSWENNTISANGYTLFIHTNGNLEFTPQSDELLAYPEDAKDGRPDQGFAASCCRISLTVLPGTTARLEIVFSTEERERSAGDILRTEEMRLQALEESCPLTHPTAKLLSRSADAYIAHRDSTNGKTILAGYPLFSDWGRDTMIALPGCTLATGRWEDAKSILRTFFAYEKDGLVPNLFPEGAQQPMYNTVDAALLLIDCVWQYLRATGDKAFLTEAWPVMERITAAYQSGTHHGIGMDTDGLIHAGQGLDQVTWMDVCVQGILPTPRHGKPVEINAYWYNALRIMEQLAPEIGMDGSSYGSLAARVKASFIEKFYMADKGYLKDVLSGTDADNQIRCNQIWALSMPFTMLEREQELSVLNTVRDHLLTDCGLRTLSPEDPQYHPFYGGCQYDRDMAYHQGTTWVFPMGAYFRAYLHVHGNTVQAAEEVLHQLHRLQPMLEEGCFGQLPEIYDGSNPREGKGCFAQAWSVGEMLRVYEAIEIIQKSEA